MLSSLDELGRVGFMAVGNSSEEAEALDDEVHPRLMREAAARQPVAAGERGGTRDVAVQLGEA